MRLSAALLLSLLVFPAQAKEWGDVRTPVPGPARVIGGPVSGCLAGAERLPSEGGGFQAVRVSRNRHWGHPATVAFVKDMGARARQAGFGDLYIGDLAQPRGGPMASLHGSHQNGLDVDIWFNLDPKPRLAPAEREEIAIVKLTTPDERRVDPALWRPEHARVLRMAADDPRVDRILVHFAIKKHLCETAGADRAWLRKLRPWRGHNEHFHVRLVCPAGSPDCVQQAAIPPGDGCDSTLEWWFLDAEERRKRDEEAARAAPRPQAGPPRPKLPAQCAAILRAP
jgi:penicillin-insensitive murein endopeptidase